MIPHRHQNRLIVTTCLIVTLAACAGKQLTQENSIEGKVAVHAARIVDTNKAISDAVKQLAAVGQLPTAKAAEVVKISVQLDTLALQLAELLNVYDTLTPGTPPQQAQTTFDQIRLKIGEMGALLTGILVPIADEGTRGQLANLVTALNSTLLTLSIELAQGVK